MRSGRIHRWEERVQGSMRPIVRFRSGLRPSLHRTMEMKTQNQISHDMWFKEWGHSKTIENKEVNVFINVFINFVIKYSNPKSEWIFLLTLKTIVFVFKHMFFIKSNDFLNTPTLLPKENSLVFSLIFDLNVLNMIKR